MRLIVAEAKCSKNYQICDFANRVALKGIVISIAMAWFIQTAGSFVTINYASLIIKSLIVSKNSPLLDPNYLSIILAVVQVVAGLMSTRLGDTFGRKTILIISLSGSAFGECTLAAYSYMHENGYDLSMFMWLPILQLSFIIFCSTAGIVALAHICAIENFPSKVRTICSST